MGCYKRKNHKKKSINVYKDIYYSKSLIDEISITINELREDPLFNDSYYENENLEVNSMDELSITNSEENKDYNFNLNDITFDSEGPISEQEYELISKKVDNLISLMTEKENNFVSYNEALELAHRALEKIL